MKVLSESAKYRFEKRDYKQSRFFVPIIQLINDMPVNYLVLESIDALSKYQT